ncbi:MAG: hypothetical protein LQ344_007552 [Seirophora lacunosa]|nr:MAG: hypothetical protein LQ344_007552 [Seirophora lacunosa]
MPVPRTTTNQQHQAVRRKANIEKKPAGREERKANIQKKQAVRKAEETERRIREEDPFQETVYTYITTLQPKQANKMCKCHTIRLQPSKGISVSYESRIREHRAGMDPYHFKPEKHHPDVRKLQVGATAYDSFVIDYSDWGYISSTEVAVRSISVLRQCGIKRIFLLSLLKKAHRPRLQEKVWMKR